MLFVSLKGWMGGWKGKMDKYKCVRAYVCAPH
jgi:hypothetical protein